MMLVAREYADKGFNADCGNCGVHKKLYTQLPCFRAMRATLNEFRGSLLTQIF
jgi:hypothetical protein